MCRQSMHLIPHAVVYTCQALTISSEFDWLRPVPAQTQNPVATTPQH